ncbi:MAG: Gfo/Idh/MocA family oxidoreductase [SAR202 cluster bacterium]|nr:Gfo/Idh/MocA family oxidoreductase [SAR202 cluster bacterium]
MAVGWAFIGTGNYPNSRMAPAAALAENTSIIAAYSRDQHRAEEFASNHGALAAYISIEGLLADSRVDVVFVASPNHLHASHAQLAAKAGKHILVEKPMATTVSDCVDTINACRANGVKLGVGFQLRFHPGHVEASRVVREGGLGEVALAQVLLGSGVRGELKRELRSGLREWWETPDMVGNARTMIGTGVHCVDDLEFILGQTVGEVAAITDGQTADAPLENLASLNLRFSGGTIGTMVCGSRMPDAINDLTIYGSDGRVLLKNAASPTLGGTLEITSETVNSEIFYEPDPLALAKWQIEGFNKAVTLNEEPRASGLDGLRSVQITHAMIESAKTKRTVRVEPIQF